ncbi:reverse transcriptase domain-containing protein [Tanacetum coccineum]
MSIQLADQSIKYPIGVCENLLVKVGKFIFQVDFVILEMDEDELVPIILGRPFLATTRAVIDVHEGKLSLRVENETITFNIEKSIKTKHSREDYLYCADHTVKLVQEQWVDTINHDSKWTEEEEEEDPSNALAVSFYPRTESSVGKPYPGCPKERGMIVVKNEKDELIPQQTVTGWRMLERLAGHEYYCFLDGFSGYFHILIALEEQEKTTFTCPYGTFTYRRMPFGLCNAPSTFQRCMTAIFLELIKDNMEVFMDNFSVFEGIILGHKVSGSGIEVDKAKIKLLVKDAPLNFSEECIQAFDTLKRELTHAPIMIELDWSLSFEIMCDASDYVVGVVLGQRIDKYFKPIHYASKMINEAQENYTATEKELLAVMFAFDKFRQYMVLFKTIVFTDHSAQRYLFTKQDAKPRLIQWILLLQEFDIEIRD